MTKARHSEPIGDPCIGLPWCKLSKVVASGTARVNVNQRFALKDAADAHEALESRNLGLRHPGPSNPVSTGVFDEQDRNYLA